MKVFATLATVLGASTATPLFQNQLHGSNDMMLNQHSMQSVLKPSMGMSMESRLSQHDNVDRRMDMNHQMSNLRNIYRDNKDIASNMMDHNMMGQHGVKHEMESNMRDTHRHNQAIAPNQYMVKDDFGNYAYSYNDQQSEKSEEGNAQSIKGQYAYIMANGVKRRVEYIADNNGFHIIRDNADPARIKRSTEPDFIQTRMEYVMDSSSLRDDALDMYRMSNMLGRDMTSSMDRNLGMEQQRYTNLMGRDSFNRNMMGQDIMGRNMMGQKTMGQNMMGQDTLEHNMMAQDTMGRNMMGRNIYNVMSNKGMTSDVSNMMGQQMNSNMMGRDMTMNMMSRNMVGQDRNSQMMGRNILGQQEMTPNTMYSNMMGQDRMDMSNNRMNSRGMSSDMMNSYSNNGLMGQRMMQKMEIERVPETYTSTRFF